MMIHDYCPCCQVTRLPHEDDCTFAVDCPDECALFDHVAGLRLTAAEREALRKVLRRVREDYFAGRFADSAEIAAVIDGLLQRLG